MTTMDVKPDLEWGLEGASSCLALATGPRPPYWPVTELGLKQNMPLKQNMFQTCRQGGRYHFSLKPATVRMEMLSPSRHW